MQTKIGDVEVSVKDFVGLVEIQRPPHNFFDAELIRDLVTAFSQLDDNPECRAIVLAAQGKSFCAGANFSSKENVLDKKNDQGRNPLYVEAVKLFANKKPVVGAIHGAAIGGGLGVALVPDFRVTCLEATFAANFVKLGFHPGFGLTYTLPRLIGQQKASLIFYTGRRIKGDEAVECGLADVLTTQDKVREEAFKLAHEIAENAPLAVMSVRATMRQELAKRVEQQTDHEHKEQSWQRQTDDFKEGIKAVAERRPGNFVGR